MVRAAWNETVTVVEVDQDETWFYHSTKKEFWWVDIESVYPMEIYIHIYIYTHRGYNNMWYIYIYIYTHPCISTKPKHHEATALRSPNQTLSPSMCFLWLVTEVEKSPSCATLILPCNSRWLTVETWEMGLCGGWQWWLVIFFGELCQQETACFHLFPVFVWWVLHWNTNVVGKQKYTKVNVHSHWIYPRTRGTILQRMRAFLMMSWNNLSTYMAEFITSEVCFASR